MSQPTAGQPFLAAGLRISIGDLDGTPGSDAFNGVVVTEPGILSNNVVSEAAPFELTAHILTELAGAAFPLGAGFAVEFHIRDLAGDPVAGSPFAGALAALPDPAGASAPTPPVVANWTAFSATIPASTLSAGETYRVTVEGGDTTVAPAQFVFHDGTIIHATA